MSAHDSLTLDLVALEKAMKALATQCQAGDRLLLEGPMGAGKSTCARFLLEALGVDRPPEGSPTFPILHRYESPRGPVVHMDLYRISSEEDLVESGIEDCLWGDPPIALVEWVSLWPSLEKAILRDGLGHRIWRIQLDFPQMGPKTEEETLRSVQILGPTKS